MVKIILASGSPRRKELLESISLSFEVVVSNITESIDPKLPPYLTALELSLIKACFVAKDLSEPSLVIGADTIVVLDDKILGKPKTKEDAYNMLNALSSKTHSVYTGVSVVESHTGKALSMYMETKVKFKALSDEIIHNYIASGEPMDKAGAYGIQGEGGNFAESIDGDFNNVVGLPLSLLKNMLKEFNYYINL